MNTNLISTESRLLLYFNMVANGCKDYISACEYTPYYCGYSKPGKEPINSYELCLFATGVIKCPGEVEKHYRDKHNKSSYRRILRAIEDLEKKKYIVRSEVIDGLDNTKSKWFMSYVLSEKRTDWEN